MRQVTLKGLVPPIAHVLLRGGKRYPTWEEARTAAASYDNEALNAFKVARSAQRHVDGSLLTASVLQLTALALKKSDVAVTDFGGATGDLGRDFLASWPGASYTVVETPALVAMMQAHGAVRFEPSIPQTCDVFFSSGTLQYVDRPMEVLAEGFASARHAVVLVRNTFCDEAQYYVQRSKLFENGYGPIPQGFRNTTVRYPLQTTNEGSVHALADRYGFHCVARLDEAVDLQHPVQVYGKQLVFMKAPS
jgi:putative methyltransferase (TIGR04325 family)